MADFELLAPGGHQKLVEEVEDRLDFKADIDGYYAQLTAGAADNLTGRGDTTTALFLYRTAGGTADIETGQAVAKSVRGNTLVWNQLVLETRDANASAVNVPMQTRDGVTTVIGDGNGSQTDRTFMTLAGVVSSVYIGHVMLIKISDVVVDSTNTGNVYIAEDWNGIYNVATSGNGGLIVTPQYPLRIITDIVGSKHYDVSFRVNLFDLTQMFGAGNEPSTVAEFEALFPEPYYEYDAGSLLSVNMEGIETVGFNQWDEEWEVGEISSETGQNMTGANTWRSKNYIPVFPNTEYYAKATPVSGSASGGSLRPRFYDASKAYIGYTPKSGQVINGSTFTTPDNAHYMRFAPRTADVVGYEVCINLSWSGRRDGEYEAFWSSQRLIDVATYFPDGMRSAGSVRDELTSTEAITRVGVVDLGTLTWTYDSEYSRFSSAILDYLPMTSSSQSPKTLIKGLTLLEAGGTATSNDGYTIANNRIWIKVSIAHPEITTSAALVTWLEANASEMLYALATPTVTPIDPALNLSYRVDDFGTERVMVPEDERSAPPVLDIAYGLNVVDFVRRAPSEYMSAASFRQYLLARDAHDGTTTTMTWDDTDNRYEFAITDTVTEG